MLHFFLKATRFWCQFEQMSVLKWHFDLTDLIISVPMGVQGVNRCCPTHPFLVLLWPFVRRSCFVAALRLSITSHFRFLFLSYKCWSSNFDLFFFTVVSTSTSVSFRVYLLALAAVFFPELSSSSSGWPVMATLLIGGFACLNAVLRLSVWW